MRCWQGGMAGRVEWLPCGMEGRVSWPAGLSKGNRSLE